MARRINKAISRTKSNQLLQLEYNKYLKEEAQANAFAEYNFEGLIGIDPYHPFDIYACITEWGAQNDDLDFWDDSMDD